MKIAMWTSKSIAEKNSHPNSHFIHMYILQSRYYLYMHIHDVYIYGLSIYITEQMLYTYSYHSYKQLHGRILAV